MGGCVFGVSTRFFVKIIDIDADECYHIVLAKAN